MFLNQRRTVIENNTETNFKIINIGCGLDDSVMINATFSDFVNSMWVIG